jgi:hypothetical protein
MKNIIYIITMPTSTKATAAIISGLEVNPEKDVYFAKPKVNDKGGKNIGVLNAHTKKSFHMSTPLMLTWGLNENEPFDGKSGPKTYDFTLQFPNEEYSLDATQKFLKNFKALEQFIKDSAVENSRDWLGKAKMTAEVVDALWSPMVKYPKDQETGEFDYSRQPQVRVKVPFWDGEFNVEIYDPDQKLLFPNDNGVELKDLITKGSQMATVLQCGGVWVASGKFGVTWRLFQAVVKPKESLKGKCHIALAKEEKEKLLSETDPVEDDKEKEKVVAVVDSEEEEEEEEVASAPAPAVPEPEEEEEGEVEVPAPPPPPEKKKRVVKKKGAE